MCTAVDALTDVLCLFMVKVFLYGRAGRSFDDDSGSSVVVVT